MASRSRNSRRATHPPSFESEISFSHRFRFVAADSSSVQGISWQKLSYMLSVAYNATTAYSKLVGIRLRSVEMWGAMASTLVPVTIALTAGGDNSIASRKETISDTSMGASSPAHIRWVPRRNTSASMWHFYSDTDYAFSISYPLNCIIDVCVDATLSAGHSEYNSTTITGGVAGENFYLCLDGPGGKLVPLVSNSAYVAVGSSGSGESAFPDDDEEVKSVIVARPATALGAAAGATLIKKKPQ